MDFSCDYQSKLFPLDSRTREGSFGKVQLFCTKPFERETGCPQRQQVAVKTVPLSRNTQLEEFIFRRVSELANKQESQHLPKLFGTKLCPDPLDFKKRNVVFFQEAFPQTLDQWMRDSHTANEWYDMIGQVIQGLSTMIRNGIIDYDTHVGNILYDPTQDRFVIIDFGLASIPLEKKFILQSAFGYKNPDDIKDELVRYSRNLQSYPIRRFFDSLQYTVNQKSTTRPGKLRYDIPVQVLDWLNDLKKKSIKDWGYLLAKNIEDPLYFPENISYLLLQQILKQNNEGKTRIGTIRELAKTKGIIEDLSPRALFDTPISFTPATQMADLQSLAQHAKNAFEEAQEDIGEEVTEERFSKTQPRSKRSESEQ